jgi:hypothetical protein
MHLGDAVHDAVHEHAVALSEGEGRAPVRRVGALRLGLEEDVVHGR